MRSGDNLIKTFARCFRLLAKLNTDIRDGFFVGLISKESENLLSDYLEFLKIRWNSIAKSSDVAQHSDIAQHDSSVAQNHILQQKIIAKYPHIVQRDTHVAQCGDTLISRIRGILLLLEIFKHLNLTEIYAPLLLERELLRLKLLLLNDSEQFTTVGARAASADSNLKNQQKNKNIKKTADNLSENLSELNSDRLELKELGVVHKQIAEFVRSKERVQNIEVFSQFADTTRRTLKRKLSELVKAGTIKRLALGKKVFYTSPNLSEFNSDRLSTGG